MTLELKNEAYRISFEPPATKIIIYKIIKLLYYKINYKIILSLFFWDYTLLVHNMVQTLEVWENFKVCESLHI